MAKTGVAGRREELFVVRMWEEHDAYGPAQWRAHVTHVVTRERRHFTSYGELCEFLDRWRER
ncbi:MAG TPA: hypothetical protein VFN49_07280 [Candidatus Aquilonibacter sp.]|nr:hypothetical protein [Candidatus Aquilonibacter sp.]